MYTSAAEDHTCFFQGIYVQGSLLGDGIIGLRVGTANIEASIAPDPALTAKQHSGSGNAASIFVGASFRLAKRRNMTLLLEIMEMSAGKSRATERGDVKYDQIILSLNYEISTRSIF